MFPVKKYAIINKLIQKGMREYFRDTGLLDIFPDNFAQFGYSFDKFLVGNP